MRTVNFIIFLGIFFSIYGLVNFYIFVRGWQSIPPGSTLRSAYAIVFWVLALAFILGRTLENMWPSPLSDLFVWMGSFWIAAMIYFFIACVVFDLLRLVHHFRPFFPPPVMAYYTQSKYVAAAGTIGLVALLLLAGHINALIPRVKTLELTIPKKVEGMKSVNIVAASDIHLGTIVGRQRFDQVVEKINSLAPDIVLLAGDIVDEDLAPVIKQNLGEALRNIKPRYGVYAITGNHEYFGGVEAACTYLEEHNVVMLRDRAVKVNGTFFLVGREDRSYNHRMGRQRKTLKELMAGVDRQFPVILMDHQPFRLNEAVDQGVDLQISGHTHHGQLWPVNYIIQALFELGWGYRKIGNTHVYVSSGLGTWGPPVRIGNRPEIVNIRLHFQ
ncbi:MAG: metallophosphoesterase [Acidobacteriia bacterium]|nr:metallophosphoesterase [Terriglobia bacterium]